MAKSILITGATSGFGSACAEIFACNKWNVILTGRRKKRLENLEKKLGNFSSIYTSQLDVRNSNEVENLITDLPQEFRDIDVLVNNAGLALGLEPAVDASLDDWEVMVDTNIKGVLYCTKAVLPGMVKRNRGHIINVGSTAGNWPYPGGNVYGATKSFVQQFSRNLRTDLLGTKVRVTNIEPGMAETEFSLVRFKGDKKKAEKVYENADLLQPEDVAEIIYWVVNTPERVNINTLEVMATCQAWGPLQVHQS
ncbi:SDR family oxidoreductase [Flexistipes sinusarabici]|uniref:SDR family oxidoreductase n=1 Tax=Flexistipes sinusarabici TaxID=2352 RepID=UPI00235333CF|nr:SDR family oxidoreductase [Flexistipes sinusarabici]